MKAPVTLSFQPVSCVLTAGADLSAEVQVFDVGSERSQVVLRSADAERRYALVLGSVMFVGHDAPTRPIDAAVIVELPESRVCAMGQATWSEIGPGHYDVHFVGETRTQLGLELRLQCRALTAVEEEIQPILRAVK
jgi:hypothetical protein